VRPSSQFTRGPLADRWWIMLAKYGGMVGSASHWICVVEASGQRGNY
jgi:hypothetical protein